MSWHVRVPATSANLGPGYDRLGLALPRYLRVNAQPATQWQLNIEGFGAESFLPDQRHPFVTVYRQACQYWNYDVEPLVVRFMSEIPLASGLGSSAALIVAALTTAQLANGEVQPDEILRLSREIEGHPDNVGPAIFGGLWDGETGRCLDLDPRVRVLCVTLDQQVATSAMRQVVPAQVDAQVAASTATLVERLMSGLASASPHGLAASTLDVRHQPFRFAVQPHSRTVFAYLKGEPAVAGAFLSGSGPTVCGWLTDGDVDLSRITKDLRERDVPVASCFIVSPELQGLIYEIGSSDARL